MDSTALMKLGSGQMLERVNMAQFPQQLSPVEKKLLAEVAITYGFDPLMGEITIYQGRPYVSIDGRYRKAQETGKLMGVRTRPATKEERDQWGIPDGDFFFRSEVFVKGGIGGQSFEGWGRVFKAETQGGKGFKPIEKNPQRMAEKRAEAQALRKAFHIPLPSIEAKDIDEDGDAPVVNTETGEIIEAKGEVVTPDLAQADKDSAELFDAMPSASPPPPVPPPPLDVDWAVDLIAQLRKKGVTAVSQDGIKAKILALKVDTAGLKTVPQVLAKLDADQAKNFAGWLQDLEKMS